MSRRSVLDLLVQPFRKFFAADRGNVALTFGIAAVPLVIAAGSAVDYSRGNSAQAAMQGALDSTALSLIKSAATTEGGKLTTSAGTSFTANFNRSEVTGVQVAAQYDASTKVLTLNASGTLPTTMMGIIGKPQMTISALSKSILGSRIWPVCVMVTNPDSNHTELVQNGGTIDFNNCMNQVNTQNWDAVEARDSSYIHSVNGVNCFTGDIHYGDVTPQKQDTCTMFPDPFASYTVPSNPCTYTNMTITSSVTLSPGTYCGGIKISSSSNVIFSPGVYYIQDGDFSITGSSSATGNGVTFLITGQSSNINFNTTGTITFSPYTGADAGKFAGFLFFWDQPSTKKGQTEVFSTGTMNFSGVIYFVGQILSITNNATVTVNPGSIIADFILPNKGHLNLTGTLNSPTAAQQAMKKSIASNDPTLVQ